MTGQIKRKFVRLGCKTAIALSFCFWAFSVISISTLEIESAKKSYSSWLFNIQGGQLFIRLPHQRCMIGVLDHFTLVQSEDYDYFVRDDIHATFPDRYDGSFMKIAIPKAVSFFDTGFWMSRRFGFHRFAISSGQCESVRRGRLDHHYIEIAIPTGWTTITTIILSFLLLRRCRLYSRGHCQACGYNLTNNTTGTCPECGTAFPLAPVKSDAAAQNP